MPKDRNKWECSCLGSFTLQKLQAVDSSGSFPREMPHTQWHPRALPASLCPLSLLLPSLNSNYRISHQFPPRPVPTFTVHKALWLRGHCLLDLPKPKESTEVKTQSQNEEWHCMRLKAPSPPDEKTLGSLRHSSTIYNEFLLGGASALPDMKEVPACPDWPDAKDTHRMGVSWEPSLILKLGEYKNAEPVPSSFFSLGNTAYTLTKKDEIITLGMGPLVGTRSHQ